MPQGTIISRDGSRMLALTHVASNMRPVENHNATVADTLTHIMGNWYFEQNEGLAANNAEMYEHNCELQESYQQANEMLEIATQQRNNMRQQVIALQEALLHERAHAMRYFDLYHDAAAMISDVFIHFPEVEERYTQGLDAEQWQEVIDLTADTDDEEMTITL